MQLPNKKHIAYLAALTLFFSYAEMLLPRIVPFFRLGLGNIAVLLALGLDFPSFFILTVIKALTASLTSGTLLSPFFLVSLTQSLGSGLIMFLLYRIKGQWLSIFGISVLGSITSAVIQNGICALYLGSGTAVLLGPMILFGILAGLITGAGAVVLKIPEKAPEVIQTAYKRENNNKTVLFSAFALAASGILSLVTDNLYFLILELVVAFTFQLLSGRKILILPHITTWIFIIVVSLFTPSGKILFKAGVFSITEGALFTGFIKALKISVVASLSQCAASLKPKPDSLAGMALIYFGALISSFRNSKGNLFKKIKSTLQAECLVQSEESKRKELKLWMVLVIFPLFLALFIISLRLNYGN